MNKKTLTAAFPAMLALLLLAIYLISPEFYLRYILQESTREEGAVEIVTVISCFTAALLLFAAARHYRLPNRTAWRQTAVLSLLVLGLAAFVFGGEEISWGQTWLGWETPEGYNSAETNLHNNKTLKDAGLSLNSLGGAFLLAVFVAFPLAHRYWKKKPDFLTSLQHIVPGTLAISFIVTGFLLKSVKSIYRSVTPDSMQIKYEEGEPLTFYGGFLEQLNEQKELYMALGLLALGLQLWKARKKAAAAVSENSTP